MCFDNSEMIEKAVIKKVKAACLYFTGQVVSSQCCNKIMLCSIQRLSPVFYSEFPKNEKY